MNPRMTADQPSTLVEDEPIGLGVHRASAHQSYIDVLDSATLKRLMIVEDNSAIVGVCTPSRPTLTACEVSMIFSLSLRLFDARRISCEEPRQTPSAGGLCTRGAKRRTLENWNDRAVAGEGATP